MTAIATSQDSTLTLAYSEYTTNAALQSLITGVVDAIIEQDSTDRGAWVRVVTRRVSLDSTYSEHEVKREIGRMLKAGSLYESCREIRDGTYTMIYVKAEEVAR